MRTTFLLFPLLFLLTGSIQTQDLALFELFTDHAVLQRDVDHPIWGWAKRNRKITLTLDDETYTTRADRAGKWTLDLPPTAAGGPHSLTVTDGRTTETLQDIYFGDVYLLSGQSNMEWRLVQSDPDGTRARAIADPLIRQVLVSRSNASTPQEHLQLDESWKPGTSEEIADFSAVGSYFAHYLREGGVEVPIGLLHSSWGGSRIEPWMSAEALGIDPAKATMNEEARIRDRLTQATNNYTKQFPGETVPTADTGMEQGFLGDRADLSTWGSMELPGAWEERGFANVDGVFYFRRTFTLTAEQAGTDATLYLGPIDDSDETYINGQQVGVTQDAYSEPREYTVPASVLRAGENTLAIRVTDTGGGGGLMGTPEMLRLQTAEGSIALPGTFRYRVGSMSASVQTNQVPTILYHAMIAPIQQWPLTGVLWYQGESNAGGTDAPAYAEQLRTLVTSWRERFDQPELPFYWVQLANFMAAPTSPNEPGWATLRQSQTAALDVPGTGQAIITDIGEADDIHPKNKWEVGRRLSLHALRNIYDRDVQASSPVAERISVEEDVARIYFRETGDGLIVKAGQDDRYGSVKSLTVRDASGNWHWALGALDATNDVLTVLNPAGTTITAVRYAWSNNPDDANLFSKNGLPVTPFELMAE